MGRGRVKGGEGESEGWEGGWVRRERVKGREAYMLMVYSDTVQ